MKYNELSFDNIKTYSATERHNLVRSEERR